MYLVNRKIIMLKRFFLLALLSNILPFGKAWLGCHADTPLTIEGTVTKDISKQNTSSTYVTFSTPIRMLEGSNLDAVWNNIVARIGNLDATSEESIEQQIIKREQSDKLLQQIESFEKRCRAEKQTRKKYEMHQKLQALKLKCSRFESS